MSGGTNDTSTTDTTVAGIGYDDEPTNQETIPAPYFSGERRIAGRFLCKVYNQYAVESASKTGKGGK